MGVPVNVGVLDCTGVFSKQLEVTLADGEFLSSVLAGV